VGEKIASGRARVIDSVAHLSEFQPGEVLVADSTTPDWEPVMKTAAAIITNRVGAPATRRSSRVNSCSCVVGTATQRQRSRPARS